MPSGLLGALFSKELSVDEKLEIMAREFDIVMEGNAREDVSAMCNLGEGIMEAAWEEGMAEGIAEEKVKVIISMYKKGYPLEEIADIAEKSIAEIKTVIEKENPS